MTKHGFKEITASNWLEQDPVLKGFVRIDPNLGPVELSGDDWAAAFLEPSLDPVVLDEIQGLFEVARGAMIYGNFFYPLFTLGAEQLYRVAEAAVKQKCTQMGEVSLRSFYNRINWLHEKSVILSADVPRWHAVRKLRNYASHPNWQQIMAPGNALGTLETLSDLINHIFDGA